MTAATASPAADTYRRQQVLLAAMLARDLIRLLKTLFNPADPGSMWPAVRQAAVALITDQRRQSADLGARYYRQARLHAGLPDAFTPRPAVSLPDEQVVANLDATGIAAYQRSLRAGARPERAVDRTSVTLTGAASRLVLDGGRSVIDQSVRGDADAIGWTRLTDADPCSWCLMMASRGAVYRSAQSAGRAKNARFAGAGQFKWHDHCGCQAVPIFDADDPALAHADELYELWAQVTGGHSGQAAVNTWRRHWAAKGKET